jgi:Arc/MetJ family transcription regulator
MALTSIDIPDQLMAEAQRLTGHSTKRGTVVQALEEAIGRRRQAAALEAMAAMEFLGDLALPDVRSKARG